ncbi:MAG TPA: hypothetical protein VFV50_03595, partial [Bdellovibrionales bacterium]|nr:hypothetical protein [Bdellovibrionales bacterium]
MKSLKDLRFPIVLKLVSVTVLLLLSATIPIAIISYMDFEEAATSREDEGNITHARSTAARVEGLLANFLYKIQVVGDQLHRTYATPDEKQRALDLSFTRDYDFVAASIYELKGDKAVLVEREIKED